MDDYEESKRKTSRYKKIKLLLKTIYSYKTFKPKQYEIINNIISGNDICAILPTGYGKSLTFQIPGLYKDQPTIVVSPLISLMEDQRIILEKLGIPSCCYNSNVADRAEMRKKILNGDYKFIYITPESVINMQHMIEKLHKIHGIALVAIDEAHCISSYGCDFRSAYRDLTVFKEWLPDVPILAVTATATPDVGKDIMNILGLQTKEPVMTSFDRPNLYLEIKLKNKKSSMIADPCIYDILPIVRAYEKQSIIIYCLTKAETDKIYESLNLHKIKCGRYHSGINQDEKTKTHQDFLNGKIHVVVATIAFGMGINKSDVRVVIHYGAPKNIEGYYQEIGRAGRDGEKAFCYCFYGAKDFILQEHFISNNPNLAYREVQMKLLKKMRRFMETKSCRRKLLLEYFDEDYDKDCKLCDNCLIDENTPKIKKTEINKTKQNVSHESKLLIDLIELNPNRSFGATMYINIIRGSEAKNIPDFYKKSKLHGKGKHKSVNWWKELIDNLIDLGYLQSTNVKGGFLMKVIKTTKQGIMWANSTELGDLLESGTVTELEPIMMMTTN